MPGIVGYGAFIPRNRIESEEIARQWGKDPVAIQRGLLLKEKSVPGLDEDTITISVAAGRAALGPGRHRSAKGRCPVHRIGIPPLCCETLGAPSSWKPWTWARRSMSPISSSPVRPGPRPCPWPWPWWSRVGRSMPWGSGPTLPRAPPTTPWSSRHRQVEPPTSSGKRISWPRSSTPTATPPTRLTSGGGKGSSIPGTEVGSPESRPTSITSCRPPRGSWIGSGHKPADFKYVVFHMPNGKFPLSAGKQMGFTHEQMETGMDREPHGEHLLGVFSHRAWRPSSMWPIRKT